MDKLKRLFCVEFYKILKGRTFFMTGIAALLYGAAVSFIIGVDNGLSTVEIASFITNSSLILIITPIIIDYTNECSNGYFQDVVSYGISRNMLFFVKKSILYIQSLLIYVLLYVSLFVTSVLRGLTHDVDVMTCLRLFLFASCIFFTGFMIAVLLERTFTLTVGCAALSIILSAIGTVINRFPVSEYYIYGMNMIVFQKRLSTNENIRFIVSSIVTILILSVIAFVKFLKTEFKNDIQEIE